MFELLSAVDIIMEFDQGLFIAYGAILAMALFPIYIGAHRSLDVKVTETMSSQDAWMFPVVGSGVLFGLYLLFKMFNKEYVNMLLTAYFLLFGVFALAATIEPVIASLIYSEKPKGNQVKFNLPFFSDPVEFTWTMADLISLVASIGVCAWYVVTKHWIANNILGIAFSIQGVAMISLGSYSIGCILLCCLFFYDIFWVFGTDVMVTVAKSFDAPIKVLFPKDIFAEEWQFSLLGLGDIVIPGIFIALLLRFDAKRCRRKEGQFNFPKPYFTFTFVGYILAMVTTLGVMHFFQAAQPALLYLVPYCILASIFAGALLGELDDLFSYSEELTKKEGEEEQPKKGKKAGKPKNNKKTKAN